MRTKPKELVRSPRGMAAGENGKRLTDRERRFIETYLINYNLLEALEAADGKLDHNLWTANRKAREILVRPAVMTEIADRFQATIMQKEEVLSRVSEQARGLQAQFFFPDGRLNLAEVVRHGKTHLIQSIRPGRFGVAVQLPNSTKALELLGKNYKLWTDKTEVDGEVVIRVLYEEEPQVDEDDVLEE